MKKKLSEFTTEELTREVETRKWLFYLYLVLILIMGVVSMMNVVQKEHRTSNYLPIIFLPICIMMWKNYKAALKELDSRR